MYKGIIHAIIKVDIILYSDMKRSNFKCYQRNIVSTIKIRIPNKCHKNVFML
jgi:hypothetical protein